MEPDKIMEGISLELADALKAMAKAKTPEEKLVHSSIVKNLSESLGVFLQLMSDMAMFDDDDDAPMPF